MNLAWKVAEMLATNLFLLNLWQKCDLLTQSYKQHARDYQNIFIWESIKSWDWREKKDKKHCDVWFFYWKYIKMTYDFIFFCFWQTKTIKKHLKYFLNKNNLKNKLQSKKNPSPCVNQATYQWKQYHVRNDVIREKL